MGMETSILGVIVQAIKYLQPLGGNVPQTTELKGKSLLCDHAYPRVSFKVYGCRYVSYGLFECKVWFGLFFNFLSI